LTEVDATLPGESLLPLASGKSDSHRDYAFSQYHGHGVSNGWFALRRGDYKYIHYHGYGAELYNLADDPDEMHDISDQPEQQERMTDFDALLHELVTPAQVDADAKADQAARLEWIRHNMKSSSTRSWPGNSRERSRCENANGVCACNLVCGMRCCNCN